jgi:hypothetical protein
MAKSRRSAAKLLTAIYLAVLAVTLLFNYSDPGRIQVSEKLSKVNSSMPDDAYSLYIQVLAFDEIHQTAKMRLYIYPPARFGNAFASSVQTYTRTQLNLDAARVDSEYSDLVWDSGEFMRAVDFEIDATNEAYKRFTNDSFFPFDQYSLRSAAQIEIQTEGEGTPTENDDTWISPPVRVVPYTSVLPGWTLNYNGVGNASDLNLEYSNGQATFEIQVARPSLHKTIAAVISLIFLLSSLAISIYSVSLLTRKKKPEVEGLVWAASNVFALIQTRSILPNNPRVGVKLDLLIFYPSLILTFLSSALIFVNWLRFAESQFEKDKISQV